MIADDRRGPGLPQPPTSSRQTERTDLDAGATRRGIHARNLRTNACDLRSCQDAQPHVCERHATGSKLVT